MLRRNRAKRPAPEIMIAPLIDIVFLLLIFFMLITRFLSPTIAVALPDSDSGVIDESRARTVTIDADGNAFLDDVSMTLQEITRELANSRLSGELDLVRLRADRDTGFQSVIDALDAIRDAEIFDVAFETDRSRPLTHENENIDGEGEGNQG